MFHGLAGICLYADDVVAARDWYTEVLGTEPYFVRPHPPEPPAYLEFRVGQDQDELGILDRRYGPGGAANPPGGAVTAWHVDDVEGLYDRLLSMAATEYEAVAEQGGFLTASVVDPFGNVLGIMHNPHFVEMHAARRA